MKVVSVQESDAGSPEATAAPGGFAQSVELLEFGRIRQALAAHTGTVIGGEAAQGLTPSADLLEVATRLQETSEACRFLSGGGGLEFGPGIDFREFVRRALLGGLLNGQELHAVSNLAEAAGHNRRALSRHEEIPLLSGIADNLPDLKTLARAIERSRRPLRGGAGPRQPGLGPAPGRSPGGCSTG